MKLFVKDLADFYKLGLEDTRVSVMSYSNSPSIDISFSRYFSNKNQFDSAVDLISYSGGGTATARALDMANSDMFTSSYGARGRGNDFVIKYFVNIYIEITSWLVSAYGFYSRVVKDR